MRWFLIYSLLSWYWRDLFLSLRYTLVLHAQISSQVKLDYEYLFFSLIFSQISYKNKINKKEKLLIYNEFDILCYNIHRFRNFLGEISVTSLQRKINISPFLCEFVFLIFRHSFLSLFLCFLLLSLSIQVHLLKIVHPKLLMIIYLYLNIFI